jgi:ubiquinone/menaquinone biosynthesis C-methylase UbiE
MKQSSFDRYWREYDAWYERYPATYQSELKALQATLPEGQGVEVGVGTGRFAAALAVPWGVDPSLPMLRLARERGVQAVQGIAEQLPFTSRSLDFVLFSLTMCFLSDIDRALSESARVLTHDGTLILGMIDADSHWGRHYRERAELSRFYRHAAFQPVRGMIRSLQRHSLMLEKALQTLQSPPPVLVKPENPEPGWGKGGFVVLAVKKLGRAQPGK